MTSAAESHATLVDLGPESRISSPMPVDDVTREFNDVTVLKGQLSSDQIVSDLDVIKTNQLIQQGREEEEFILNSAAVTTVNPWEMLKKAGINIFLPFINGLFLGFGEIVAHEIGFHYGWFGAKISPPRRMERKRQLSQYL